MNIVAIIQARMGSTRLPGKVLVDLAGEPVLSRVVTRSQRAARIDETVVATTTEPADEPIVELCATGNWPWFRGSEDDVLDRYYQGAKERGADVVVRITSDCPLIDPSVVDDVVNELFEKAPVDYTSNTLAPRTFPRGLDVEAMTFNTLERAWHEDTDLRSREHVTPYIYRHPGTFRLTGVFSAVDYSWMRWTVDTSRDLAFVRRIYDHFGHDRFSWQDVLAVLESHPEWLELNRYEQQKMV